MDWIEFDFAAIIYLQQFISMMLPVSTVCNNNVCQFTSLGSSFPCEPEVHQYFNFTVSLGMDKVTA